MSNYDCHRWVTTEGQERITPNCRRRTDNVQTSGYRCQTRRVRSPSGTCTLCRLWSVSRGHNRRQRQQKTTRNLCQHKDQWHVTDRPSPTARYNCKARIMHAPIWAHRRGACGHTSNSSNSPTQNETRISTCCQVVRPIATVARHTCMHA